MARQFADFVTGGTARESAGTGAVRADSLARRPAQFTDAPGQQAGIAQQTEGACAQGQQAVPKQAAEGLVGQGEVFLAALARHHHAAHHARVKNRDSGRQYCATRVAGILVAMAGLDTGQGRGNFLTRHLAVTGGHRRQRQLAPGQDAAIEQAQQPEGLGVVLVFAGGGGDIRNQPVVLVHHLQVAALVAEWRQGLLQWGRAVDQPGRCEGIQRVDIAQGFKPAAGPVTDVDQVEPQPPAGIVQGHFQFEAEAARGILPEAANTRAIVAGL